MEGQVIRIHSTLKLVGIAAVAAVLAACSGTGSTPTVPTSGGQTAQATYPRTAMGADGHAITFMYNKDIELSGRVTTGTPGTIGTGRTPMSMITGAMTYHGGPIQTAPKLYIVEWGNWSSGDPDGVGSYYNKFVNAIGGSTWLSTVTQYTQSGGQHVGNSGSIYGGTWNDTVDAINTRGLSGRSYQSYLAAEAAKAEAHFGDNSVNASYVIMLPHGVKVNGFGTSYCAWHSSTSAGGGTIAYTNLPYIPDAGSSCGANSVSGVNDGVSIVGGHEQAETETDPQPNSGWLDSGNNEIGDKCAWYNLANTSFSGGTFPTQPLWSNSANNCVQ